MHEPFITPETDVPPISIGIRQTPYVVQSHRRTRLGRFRAFVGGAPLSEDAKISLEFFCGLMTAVPITLAMWIAIYQLVMLAL